MSKPSASTQRSRFYPALLLLLASGVIGLSAWSAISSPALASIINPGAVSAPTHAQSFAVVQIIKPAYTPTALPSISNEFALLPGVASPNTPIPESTASEPPAAPPYNGNKYILVDISEQHMYVYEGEMLVYSFVASTGMRGATRVGTFSVLDKIPNAYGSTWNIWMPNWLGIYYSSGLENGIHALPILPNGATLWEGFLGTPISYGCVVLGTYESQLLYDWVDIGTPVEIQR